MAAKAAKATPSGAAAVANDRDNVIHAAEAVYTALGYAMSGYISKVKKYEAQLPCENSITEMCNDLGKMREELNNRYKLGKKAFTAKPMPNHDEWNMMTANQKIETLRAISEGCSFALSEMMDSLVHYRIHDSVRYDKILKKIQKSCIYKAVALLRKMQAYADDEILYILLEVK
jgi:hypothetical protein